MNTPSVCQGPPRTGREAAPPLSAARPRARVRIAVALVGTVLAAAGCEAVGSPGWHADKIDDARISLAPVKAGEMTLLVTGATSGRKEPDGTWIHDLLQALDPQTGK